MSNDNTGRNSEIPGGFQEISIGASRDQKILAPRKGMELPQGGPLDELMEEDDVIKMRAKNRIVQPGPLGDVEDTPVPKRNEEPYRDGNVPYAPLGNNPSDMERAIELAIDSTYQPSLQYSNVGLGGSERGSGNPNGKQKTRC